MNYTSITSHVLQIGQGSRKKSEIWFIIYWL